MNWFDSGRVRGIAGVDDRVDSSEGMDAIFNTAFLSSSSKYAFNRSLNIWEERVQVRELIKLTVYY